MSIILALALAAGPRDLTSTDEIPPFYGAQEKWACKFESFVSHDTVTGYFGAYRSHVADDIEGDHFVVQNDDKALVFVESDIGVVHSDGKVLQSVVVTMIEKTGQRRFKRSGLDLAGNPIERTGACTPY
jgi:hypothetical protein